MQKHIPQIQELGTDVPNKLGKRLMGQGVNLCRLSDLAEASNGQFFPQNVVSLTRKQGEAVTSVDVANYLQTLTPVKNLAEKVDQAHAHLVENGTIRASGCYLLARPKAKPGIGL